MEMHQPMARAVEMPGDLLVLLWDAVTPAAVGCAWLSDREGETICRRFFRK